ncbi:hypothetical protein LEP1GSC049_4373 [Leptospira kirschneri serovar Cynopteri str. 3522 CT]|nr:hypothetical protein LEP1GSC044_2933 [Leptospira kirschneri serovar Grippotyphosa str. RM52]EKQ82646.1 hypothetical protein LEP1GSC064_1937 [Leptospira kirschneri serovar Grippotyphosa str. Moskva]EKR07439.1 hypothetical protein LEP1GSC122_2571 [Leptospira kirschneri serovar Valbuzzi str. 200702274]EMK02477.1 hypothetical protein LEP1GSC176_2349 [Leptospira kirschneri str. MMD1493]EMN26127.1 hypothetical protein LEP1GSC065_1210 [Leptospira kirschneri serovar Sokoine str. RM1]EMO81041.1 hypo
MKILDKSEKPSAKKFNNFYFREKIKKFKNRPTNGKLFSKTKKFKIFF